MILLYYNLQWTSSVGPTVFNKVSQMSLLFLWQKSMKTSTYKQLSQTTSHINETHPITYLFDQSFQEWRWSTYGLKEAST